MITIMFHLTMKLGREEECTRVIREATKTTTVNDDGCVTYTYLRRADKPRELVLFEQWADAYALNAHLARLQRVYGPPDDNEPHPPTHHRRRLPKAFLDLFERTTEAVRYEVVE